MSLRDVERLASALEDIFAGTPLPRTREVRQVFAAARVLRGDPVRSVAADFRLQRRGVAILVDRVRAEGLAGLTPFAEHATPEALSKRRQGIGQMLLGVLAERRFDN